jgi:hypothetical protein
LWRLQVRAYKLPLGLFNARGNACSSRAFAMLHRVLIALLVTGWLGTAAQAGEAVRLKAAVAALTDDTALRRKFEQDLVETGLAHGYDAVSSYDIVQDVHGLDEDTFLKALQARGVQIVLLIRPAAIGPGSSLDVVKNEVPAALYQDMRQFASHVSRHGPDDLIAVMHLGIYALTDAEPQHISSGAVWLDEPVEDRAQALQRLESLIVQNVDAVRPAIRKQLGLPPLP